MRVFKMGISGFVVSVFLFGSVGSVLAQGLFKADPADLQFERDVRSTYIVRLASDLPSQAVNNRANEVAARFGGRIKFVYTNALNGFAITMPSVAMARMIEAGGLDIISVSRDGIVSIDAKGGQPGKPVDEVGDPPVDESSCNQELPWGVARVTGILMNSNSCTVTDGAVTDPNYGSVDRPSVCVIDTGVDIDHPDLNVSTNDYYNAILKESRDDLHGHGSHVAGTIGAKANNIGVIGVAPGASIVSVKVLNRRGSGSYSGVIAGVDYVAGANVCAVANMSLGGPISTALDAAVKCAAADSDEEYVGCPNPGGVTFTLAAGNSGDNAANHSPARIGNTSTNIHTIAAMTINNTWISWSNWGDPVDYIEPGVNIPSTFKNGGYKTYSGTSMAAPHMAGLVLRHLVNGGEFSVEGNAVSGPGGEYFIAVD